MDFFAIKQDLINELWLPITIQGSKKLYPHRLKHKKMSLFTLTDREHKEVASFENDRIIKRNLINALSSSLQNMFRLECDLGKSEIIDSGKFEDMIDDPEIINKYLLCDILNIDYSSQKPLKSKGRIENELRALNKTIEFLSQQTTKGYILIYTTPLNGLSVKVSDISFQYTKPDSFNDIISNINDKELFLTDIIKSIAFNNNYDEFKKDTKIKTISNDFSDLFSLAGVYLRRCGA